MNIYTYGTRSQMSDLSELLPGICRVFISDVTFLYYDGDAEEWGEGTYPRDQLKGPTIHFSHGWEPRTEYTFVPIKEIIEAREAIDKAWIAKLQSMADKHGREGKTK